MNATKFEFWEKVNAEVCRDLIDQGGKISGDYINHIDCPSCGKREAWASAKTPTKIHCNRLNKCGAVTLIDRQTKR